MEALLDLRTGRRFQDETRPRPILGDQFVAHSRGLRNVTESENRLEDVTVKVVSGGCGTLDLCCCACAEVKRSVPSARLLKPQILLGQVEVRHVTKPGSFYTETGGSRLQSRNSEVESRL